MKNLIKCFLLVTSITMSNNIYSNEITKTLDHNQMIQLLGDTITDNQLNPSWPKFSINSTPSIIGFESGETYAYNLQLKNPIWQLILIGQKYWVGYINYDYWGIKNLGLSCSLPIDSQPSYILVVPEIIDELTAARFFTHERFHCFQTTHFQIPQVYYDYKYLTNIDNAQISYLESFVLADYLRTPDIELLKDFIAIHSERIKNFDDHSKFFENWLEVMEGTANYNAYKQVPSTTPIEQAIIAENSQKCSLDNVINCIGRQRYYFTGNAAGRVLDNLGIQNWKEQTGSNFQSPVSILSHLFPMSEEEIKKRISESKQKEKFSEFSEQIKINVENYTSQMQEALNTFYAQPGVLFGIDSTHGKCEGGGSIEKHFYITPLIDLNINSKEIRNCYSGNVLFNYNLPYVYADNLNNLEEFFLADNIEFSIDGVRYLLADIVKQGKSITFKQLSIKSPNLTLQSSQQSGIIQIKNGVWLLNFS